MCNSENHDISAISDNFRICTDDEYDNAKSGDDDGDNDDEDNGDDKLIKKKLLKRLVMCLVV